MTKLKSPQGQFYNSVAQAMKALYDSQDRQLEMEVMKRFMAKEGWFTTDLLPPGFWLRQKRSERSFCSLSPTYEQFRTMRPLFNHLRQVYGAAVLARFEANYKSLQVEPTVQRAKMAQKTDGPPKEVDNPKTAREAEEEDGEPGIEEK